MSRPVIPVFLPSFEERNLCVLASGIFKGPRLVVDGKVMEPMGKYYFLRNNSNKLVKIRLRRRFLDPIPDVDAGDLSVEIAPPFRWYEQLWMSLAGSLMYLNIGFGFLMGLLAYSFNTRVFRSSQTAGLKFLFSGLISLGSVTAFFTLLLAYTLGSSFLRLERLESDLNADGLKEIHKTHEPPRKSVVPDSLNSVDAFGYPRDHVDRIRVLALLQGGQFSQLNALLQSLQSGYERDFRKEQILSEGYAAFGIVDSAAEGSFNQWVARFPRSYIPYLARASYECAVGIKTERADSTAGDSLSGRERAEARFDAAEEDIATALSLEPRLLVAYRLLILEASARGDFAAEALYVRKALVLCPLSFVTREQHIRFLLPRWGGSYAAVAAFAKESMAYAGINPKLAVLQGYADWDRGRAAEAKHDYPDAFRFYASALQYGDYPLFLLQRGEAYISQEQYPQALADLKSAQAGDPFNLETLTSLAVDSYKLGLIREAASYLHTATTLDAQSAQVAACKLWICNDLVTHGNAKGQAKDYQGAIELFNRAAEFDPNNAVIFFYRAYAYASMGESVQAINDALTAIRIDPSNIESYRLLSQFYAERGEWDMIVSSWDKLIALEPGNGAAYLERAKAYMQRGDRASAIRDAEKACTLGQYEGCEAVKKMETTQ